MNLVNKYRKNQLKDFVFIESKIGKYVTNNYYQKNNKVLLLESFNHLNKKTPKNYFKFDYEDFDILKNHIWYLHLFKRNNKIIPKLETIKFNKEKKRSESIRFEKFYKRKYYPNAKIIFIEFKSSNKYDYRKENLKIKISEKEKFVEDDLNQDENIFIKNYMKRNSSYIFLKEIKYTKSSNLMLYKKNIYFQKNNKECILLILKYNSFDTIMNYKEVLFSIEDLNYLMKKYWIYQNFDNVGRCNRKGTWYISNEYDSNIHKNNKISLPKYIIDRKYNYKNNEKGEIIYKNGIHNDLRRENLFFKIKSLEQKNLLINENLYENIENSFRRYCFISLDEIPKDWIFLGKNEIETNFYYKISHEICLMLIRNFNKNILINNKFYNYIGTIFDLEDYIKLNLYKNNFYIRYDKNKPNYLLYVSCNIRKNNKRIGLFHRLIMNMEVECKNLIVDHINRDTLDNRKINLRKVNVIKNNRNISIRNNTPFGVLGVYFQKNKWKAERSIKIGEIDGKNRLRVRSVTSHSYEEAINNRKKLELISDNDFISSIDTIVLLEEYEQSKKFMNL